MGARKAGSSTLVTAWSLGDGSAPRARSTGETIKRAARTAGFHMSNGLLIGRDWQSEPKAWLLGCFQIVCNQRCHSRPSNAPGVALRGLRINSHCEGKGIRLANGSPSLAAAIAAARRG